MSSSVFVGDHIVMDVCLDSAKCQLKRLAGDSVLLGASEYAYGTGITGQPPSSNSRSQKSDNRCDTLGE